MKKNRIIHLFVLAFILFGLFMLSGCDSNQSIIASLSKIVQVKEKSNEQVQKDILATAIIAAVDTSSKNWDEDLQDDGIIAYPELRNISDDAVKFEGIELKVDIEIWTRKIDDDFKEVRDRKIYNSSWTIDSWKYGTFIYDKGIIIPFEEIKAVESDSDYGELYVKIYANDGVYEAKSPRGVRIKPKTELKI